MNIDISAVERSSSKAGYCTPMLFDPVYTNRFSSLIFGKNRGTTPPDGILLKKLPLIPLFLSICIDQYSNKEYICSRQQLPIQTNGEISMIDLCAIRRLQTTLRTFEKHLKDETGLSFNDALLLCAVNKGVTEPGLLAKNSNFPLTAYCILDTSKPGSCKAGTLLPRLQKHLVPSPKREKAGGNHIAAVKLTLPADWNLTELNPRRRCTIPNCRWSAGGAGTEPDQKRDEKRRSSCLNVVIISMQTADCLTMRELITERSRLSS